MKRAGRTAGLKRASSILAALLIVSAIALTGAKKPPKVGSPESVLPPCYVPTGVNTTRWQRVKWNPKWTTDSATVTTTTQVWGSFRLPPTFHADTTTTWLEGGSDYSIFLKEVGKRWSDGPRRFERFNSPDQSFVAMWGQDSSVWFECLDMIAGIPLRLITAYNGIDRLYRVAAVVPADSGTWLWGESPDSADQRLFLAIIRTLRADSTRSGSTPAQRQPR
jgi:hypothetical protein